MSYLTFHPIYTIYANEILCALRRTTKRYKFAHSLLADIKFVVIFASKGGSVYGNYEIMFKHPSNANSTFAPPLFFCVNFREGLEIFSLKWGFYASLDGISRKLKGIHICKQNGHFLWSFNYKFFAYVFYD